MIGTIISIGRIVSGSKSGSKAARFVAKLAGIALVVLTFGLWNRRQGAQGEKAKSDRVALDNTLKGQEAARKGRAEANEQLRQGKTPEEIVRSNDDAWR